MADAKPQPPARLNDSGEMLFTMEGVDYVLRPSMEAIEAIETQTGRALIDLAQSAQGGRLSLGELSIIVTETAKAWGREAGPNDDPNQLAARQFTAAGVRPHIYAAGALQVNARLVVLLIGAVSGGYDARGKAQPAWLKAMEEGRAGTQTPDED